MLGPVDSEWCEELSWQFFATSSSELGCSFFVRDGGKERPMTPLVRMARSAMDSQVLDKTMSLYNPLPKTRILSFKTLDSIL